jgi:hypothetical protein
MKEFGIGEQFVGEEFSGADGFRNMINYVYGRLAN